MRKKSTIAFLLLFFLSFDLLHAFTLKLTEVHEHSASEYVQEFSPSIHKLQTQEDICHLHYEFHTAFILPQSLSLLKKADKTQAIFSIEKNYYYRENLQLLKPPRA